MARIKVTVTVSISPDHMGKGGEDSADWYLSDSERTESGNPLFHAAEVDGRLAELARRAHAAVVTRFGEVQD